MARKRKDWLQIIGSGESYAHRVHRPLQCLIFISPLLFFYQVMSAIDPWTPEQGSTPLVEAFVLMLKFFGIFGVAGSYFPLLAVVAILVAWHLARKDKLSFEPRLYMGMAAESILWSLPIFILGLAFMRYTSPPPAAAIVPVVANIGELPFKSQLVLSVGAGIYEELLFRLIAITVLNILLVDVFEMKVTTAIPIIIITSALLFSAYHYLGHEDFEKGVFLFRTGIGVYLAGIYIYRGFGIAVGAHTVYDVIVATYWQSH